MYQRILVTVDGSPTSNAGLAETLKLTKLTSARVWARVQHGANEIPILMGGGGIVLGTTANAASNGDDWATLPNRSFTRPGSRCCWFATQALKAIT